MKTQFDFEFSIGGIEGLATIEADCFLTKQEVTRRQGVTLWENEIEIENPEISDVGTSDESEFPSEWMGELLEAGKVKLKDAIEDGKITVE